MTRRMGNGRVLAAALVTWLLAAPASAWSGEGEEFDEANIFFELNDTDGDLGIHSLIDGDAWKTLRMLDPDGKKLLNIKARGGVKQQGLTELFFESAEPTFDELTPEEFFDRFPAGTYRVEAHTLEGEKLASDVEVSDVMPAPPDFLINGEPARPEDGSDCDEEDLPQVGPPVVMEWNPVTEHHPEVGAEGAVEIVRYQAIAEWEDEDENTFESSVDILPDGRVGPYSVTVSPEFFVDGTEGKFELLVRGETGNQTAVESCPYEFVLP